MSRFHVPRRWLLASAGITWAAVGLLLCLRSYEWTFLAAENGTIIEELAGIALAFFLYSLALSKIAQKNIDRIRSLPGKTHLYKFIPLKSYAVIAGMIGLGIVLRHSSLPKEWLILPYAAMGGALLLGSVLYLRSLRDSL